LGSGLKKRTDAVNVDLVEATSPDVVHNLNVTPWPFPENRFSEVLAFDVFEHLDNIVSVMEEVHRVCSDGAILKVTVPHFSCANAFTDPTHRHYFGAFSLDYFTDNSELSFYSTRRFQLRASTLVFYPSCSNRIVGHLANKYKHSYERRWAWLFPAWFLYFELQIIKRT